MTAPKMTCLWPTGQHGNDVRCGKPAKAMTIGYPFDTREHPERDIPVCGIHRRSATRWHIETIGLADTTSTTPAATTDEENEMTNEEAAIVRLALTAHGAKYNAVRDVQRQLGTTYAEALAMVDNVMDESETGD